MQAKFKVDTTNLDRGMIKYLAAVRGDLAGALREVGRFLCVQLAKYTKPWGLTGKTKKKIDDAIEKDIDKVYVSSLYAVGFRNHHILKLEEDGDWQALEVVLNRASEREWNVTTSVDREAYFGAFNNRGRINAKWVNPRQIVRTQAPVNRLKRERKQQTGRAKGAFAFVASLLGGNGGGFGKWMQRHKGEGSVVDRSALQRNPYIVISNNVPYIGQLLDAVGLARAVSVTNKNLENRARAIMRKRSRKI